jgi:hypothetical protein
LEIEVDDHSSFGVAGRKRNGCAHGGCHQGHELGGVHWERVASNAAFQQEYSRNFGS